jgi:hypothetical protein
VAVDPIAAHAHPARELGRRDQPRGLGPSEELDDAASDRLDRLGVEVDKARAKAPERQESVRGGGAEIRAEEEKQQREVEKILR